MQTLNNEFPSMPIDIKELHSTLSAVKRATKNATIHLNNFEYTIIPLKKLVKEIIKTTSIPQIDIRSHQHANGDLTFIATGRAEFNYRIYAKLTRKFLAQHGNSFGDKLAVMTEAGKYYTYTFPEGDHHEMNTKPTGQWTEITYQQATQLIVRGFNSLRVIK